MDMSKDVYYKIMEDMDIRSLLNFCQTNKYIRDLCRNDYFWKRRFEKHIGYGKFKPNNITWRKYYLYLLAKVAPREFFSAYYVKEPLVNFLLNENFGKYTDEIRLTLKLLLKKRIFAKSLLASIYVIWFKLNRDEKTGTAKAGQNMNKYLHEGLSIIESHGGNRNRLSYTSSMVLFSPYFILPTESTPKQIDELNSEENRIMIDNARNIIYDIKEKINW